MELRRFGWLLLWILVGTGLRLLSMIAGYFAMAGAGSLIKWTGPLAAAFSLFVIPLMAFIFMLPAFGFGVVAGAWNHGRLQWLTTGSFILGWILGTALLAWLFLDPVVAGVEMSREAMRSQFFSLIWALTRYDPLAFGAIIVGVWLGRHRRLRSSSPIARMA